MDKNLPIAVMDSGVGGISVLAALMRELPHEDFLYFGDSKNAPYGKKGRDEVLKITRENLEMLLFRGIKAFVIACNTATSVAAKPLREEYPNLCIVGIEPAVKPAVLMRENPTVLVMATTLTLKEEKFSALAGRFESVARVLSCPCPGLVELIEAGILEGEALRARLGDILSPFSHEKIDAVVLGCTHYPHIKSEIAAFFPKDTPILDGGEGTARQTRRRLAELDLLQDDGHEGRVEFVNSAPSERLLTLSKALLERQ